MMEYNNKSKSTFKTDIQDFRKKLPIRAYRDEIISCIIKNFVTIVVGETGSGKSTQLPQYILDDGQIRDKIKSPHYSLFRVCVTQPRRVAAISMANRVAFERQVSLGKEVGYCIRFDDCSSSSTVLKYVTDGIALRELLESKGSFSYQVFILDEAHERSLNTDILIALLKRVSPKEGDALPNFRVVITSATLDVNHFSQFFNNAPIINIPGRIFPIHIVYAPMPVNTPQYYTSRNAPSRNPLIASEAMIEWIVNIVIQLHLSSTSTDEALGHILVFFTGKAACEAACEMTKRKIYQLIKNGDVPVGNIIITPLYGALSNKDQSLVFKPCDPDCRKVIYATNVAETSLTIEGVEFVIDSGFVKQKQSHPTTGVESLTVVPLAKSQAIQRCGRAGRSKPGKCFRIYSEDVYESMRETPTLEMRRLNLSSVVLQLKSLGCQGVLDVEFLDPPPRDSLLTALKQLYLLGALDREGNITELGVRLVKIALHPIYARCVIEAEKYDVLDDVAAIVSLLSVEPVWVRPTEQYKKGSESKSLNAKAAVCHERFCDPSGDHLTLLNAFNAFRKIPSHQRHQWCIDNFLQHRALLQSCSIQAQIIESMNVEKFKRNVDNFIPMNRKKRQIFIRKALCSGCFINCAKLSNSSFINASASINDKQRWYWITLKDGIIVGLDKSSNLYASADLPEFVIFNEVVGNVNLNKNNFRGACAGLMTVVTVIKNEWIEPLLHKFTDIDIRSLSNSASLSNSETNQELAPFEPPKIHENIFVQEAEKIEIEKKQLSQINSARERYLERKKN